MKWRNFRQIMVLLALATTACEAQKTVPVPIQTATLPRRPIATTTPQAPPPISCDAVDAANQKIFRDFLTKWEGASFPDGGAATLDDVIAHPCLATTASAWSVAIESIDPSTYPMFSANWSLVHVDRNGSASRYRGDEETFTAEASGGSSGPQSFWTADLDDDGEPEIVFTYDVFPVEKSETSTMLAFRYANGKIAPYDPVRGWTDLRDVDNDGRLDAVVDHAVTDEGGCGIYESEDLNGPTLVAHGVHGGFSTTDAVAKREALGACPTKPKRIIALKNRIVDETETASNAICSRIYGVSAADVVHQIESACHPFVCATTDARPALPGECFHLETLKAWAKEDPIVTLP